MALESLRAAGSVGTESGALETTKGTFYVSKPFRSKTSKKLRAIVTFEPRKSHFDTSNELSGTNEFRGFFTLFWMSLFLFTLQTYVSSVEANGYALSFAFATMFSRDAIVLALSDAVLVLTTGLCVPFAKAVTRGRLRYYWEGVVLQHVLQDYHTAPPVTRQWPWVQSGYLTLHSFVMIMKMHSYMSVNGYLQDVLERSQHAYEELRSLTEEQVTGGWETALREAEVQLKEASRKKDNVDGVGSRDQESSIGSPEADAVIRSLADPSTADALRRRLVAVSEGRDGNKLDRETSADIAFDVRGANSSMYSPSYLASPIPAAGVLRDVSSATCASQLVHHPNPSIASAAHRYLDLDSELESTGPNKLRYPENVTLGNFIEYMLIPTLVYELEYPRTDCIRPLYVFEKTVAFMGSFALLYTVTESFIIPLTPTPGQSFLRSLLDLALPFMIAYLLLFYIIFECICNGFAELSRFADRQFYEDWWNSTSWDEFSRKWNKPVHTFLLRHVYASTLASYPSISRTGAMVITFLLSAAAHELVMVIVTHKIRLYLFLMQTAQIPLILVSRMPAIKRNKLLGNVVFWIGLYAGFPLLCVAYVAY
ncbi:MBOAT, membrane-bound O-acyltransferase family-domain-containing protein [Pisolithus marmoratus]|nr:MBOAT, membrane-bound O-acyltransferase family-domain-containing protein [Pisolithus marmoratus]